MPFKKKIIQFAIAITVFAGIYAIMPTATPSKGNISLNSIHTDRIAVIAATPKTCPGPWFVEAVD